MKYAIIIPDGCADEAQESLGNKTPLQAARVPHMDAVAAAGAVGLSNNTPPQLPSGSDVATMSLFGYDPLRFHTGRAPIEAAAQGIPLADGDWAVRCNFVTVEHGCMHSFTAGQIPTELSKKLVEALNARLGAPGREFHLGVSYRNLLVLRGGGEGLFDSTTRTTPPHDITDQEITPHLPAGTGSALLNELMLASGDVLKSVPENSPRGKERHVASQIWLWGQGRRPALQNFAERFGVYGAMITAVDLLRGLAQLLGWVNISVPGATGYLDTDYAAKGRYAVEVLKEHDLVVVHVEATDEASHEGWGAAKVEALEKIDEHIVGPVHAALKQHGDYRILISPDHPTFLRTKTHSYGDVPFAVAGTGVTRLGEQTYDEVAAARGGLRTKAGYDLMGHFLQDPTFGAGLKGA